MEKSIVPTYYSSLEVENVRCFGSPQTLDLTDERGRPAQWTLLLGDNGVGKTTLLECLAWPVPDVPEGESDLAKKRDIPIKPILDSLDDNSEIDALIRSGDTVSARIKVELSHGTFFDSRKPSSRSPTVLAMNLSRAAGSFEGIENSDSKTSKFQELNVYAYSANRHMQANYFTPGEESDSDVHLFSESGDLYDPEKALLDLDHMALKKDERAAQLLKSVKSLLVDLLPLVNVESDIDIVGPIQVVGEYASRGGVQINTHTGRVPLPKLSLGYKTVFAWAVDFSLRMFFRHPTVEFPLEQPAIALIDEIDLHLHPKWQRDIREYLTSNFPNTQFICTAHSPLIAQDAERDNIAVLVKSGDEIHIVNDPVRVRGWRIDQVLTSELFGLQSARSKEVQKLIDERRALLKKKRRSKADKSRIMELDAKIAALPVSDFDGDQEIADLLKRYGRNRNRPPTFVRNVRSDRSSFPASATSAALGRVVAGRSSSRRFGRRANPSSLRIVEIEAGLSFSPL